jgi:hypothetical protein
MLECLPTLNPAANLQEHKKHTASKILNDTKSVSILMQMKKSSLFWYSTIEFGRGFAANSLRMQPSNSPVYPLMRPVTFEAKKVLEQLGRIGSSVYWAVPDNPTGTSITSLVWQEGSASPREFLEDTTIMWLVETAESSNNYWPTAK